MNSEQKSRGAIAWMARNSVAANLLMALFILGGGLLATRVKQEVFPEFELDEVDITVPYPGAGPEEVEKGILRAIEEEVRGLDGVKRVESTASEGAGSVRVELLIGANKDKALQDVKNAVDRITSFPEDAERPIVSLPTTRRQVIDLLIHGEFSQRVLRGVAERVRDEMLADPEITLVTLAGVPDPEIAIEVPQANLRRYDLTLDRIAAEVGKAAVEMPGGGVKTDAGEVLLRTAERRDLAREFRDVMVISTPAGSTVRLSDIADIEDTFEETDIAAYFDGEPAVMLRVFRVGEQTPIEVSRAVHDYVDSVRERMPEGMQFTIMEDWSDIYWDRVTLLLRNAAIGLTLVLLILGLFLDVRLAFWVTMGIPVSFLGAMLFMPAFGVTFNMISLFAFIMALGIVVDDAIVVGENVYEMRQEGRPRIEAAIAGAKMVALPVVFSVLTNVAAFMPLFFVPGVVGKWFRVIPSIVVAIFMISLIESLFILPAHLGHQRKEGPRGVLGAFHRGVSAITHWPRRACHACLDGGINRVYEPLIRRIVRYRYLTLAAGVAVLVTFIGIVQSGRIKIILLPKVEADSAQASVMLPFGSPLSQTHRVRRQLEEGAQKVLTEFGGEEMSRGMFTLIGQPLPGGGPRGGTEIQITGSHILTVEMLLEPLGKRDFSLATFVDRWREEVGEIVGIETLTYSYSIGPSAGEPIDVELSHSDIPTLERAATALANELATFSGVKDIDDGYSPGKPQLDLTVRPEARSLGVTATDLGRQVRAAFYGAEALRQQRGRDEVKVMVRLPESERRSEFDIESLLIRTPQGGEMPLMEAARVERGRAYTAIYRTDGRRVLNVTGDVEIGVDANKILSALRERVLPELMARFPGLSYEIAGERRELNEAFGALAVGFVLAVIVIYALLAVPLGSYVQPLIIMTAIPFGFVGAVLGHMIMGYDMSMISMMGIVALSGVVVNDSLVLTHAINARRKEGAGALEATVSAGMRRFRPILLTSLTTFAGLAPMIFETSFQARFLIPMAIALGYGVLFATLITLLLVPAIYLIVEDLRKLGGWVAG